MLSIHQEKFLRKKLSTEGTGAIHHLAFKAESCDEVDRLYPLIKNVGADIVKPPQYYPQHGENYYALFFKDLEGIKYEIVYDKRG